MTQGFRIEALTSAHDRKKFSCGVELLDRYLRELATQDIKRRVSNSFVALDDAGAIAGYYTFAATSLPLTELSTDMAKRLPRYTLVRAGLIGRLAIDQRFQGKRLGGALIMDAATRTAIPRSSRLSSPPRMIPLSLWLSFASLFALRKDHSARLAFCHDRHDRGNSGSQPLGEEGLSSAISLGRLRSAQTLVGVISRANA